MPRRTLARAAASATLAVSVLTGFAAMSASADGVAPIETTPVVEVVEAPASRLVAPLVQTATPEPVMFQAAYTRW